MEKKKLSLNDIKVSSFVTEISLKEEETVKGENGTTESALGVICFNSLANWCPISTPFRFRLSPIVDSIIEGCIDPQPPNNPSQGCHTDVGGYCSAPGRICA